MNCPCPPTPLGLTRARREAHRWCRAVLSLTAEVVRRTRAMGTDLMEVVGCRTSATARGPPWTTEVADASSCSAQPHPEEGRAARSRMDSEPAEDSVDSDSGRCQFGCWAADVASQDCRTYRRYQRRPSAAEAVEAAVPD